MIELNFVGVFMVLLLSVLLVIVNFSIHDCSLELDYKSYSEKTTNNKTEKIQNCKLQSKHLLTYDSDGNNSDDHYMNINENYDDGIKGIVIVICSLCREKSLILMYFSTGFFMYIMISFDIILPLITYQSLLWNIEAYSIIVITFGVCYFLSMIIFSRYCHTDGAIYNMLMVCTAFIMVSCAALYLIKRLDRNFSLDIMLMIVFIFGNIFGWFNATMIVGSITTKMIPSNL